MSISPGCGPILLLFVLEVFQGERSQFQMIERISQMVQEKARFSFQWEIVDTIIPCLSIIMLCPRVPLLSVVDWPMRNHRRCLKHGSNSTPQNKIETFLYIPIILRYFCYTHVRTNTSHYATACALSGQCQTCPRCLLIKIETASEQGGPQHLLGDKPLILRGVEFW